MNKLSGLLAASVVAVIGLAGASMARAAEPAAAQPAPAMHHHHHGKTAPKHVERVQQALNSNGAQLAVDGKWGPKTEAALKQFQQAHGLKATGHLDHATQAQLKLI